MTATTKKTIDLGPTSMKDSSGKFLLSTAEWLAIQSFISAALVLPTTLPLLAAKLPSHPTGGIDGYKNLVDGYKNLNTACADFDTVILPATIKCASDLITFNISVPGYYNAILAEYGNLVKKPKDRKLTDAEKAKNAETMEKISGLCAALAKKAKRYADHAESVFTKLTAFSAKTVENQTAVTNLNTEYGAKLTGKNGSITKLKKQLEDDKNELKATQDEYDHDVIVAATTASYVLAWPFGTLAAGIVAGIYGDKAVKAKAKIEAYQKLIGELEGTLAADTIISLDLTQIKTDLGNIGTKIAAALPSIQKIRGMWGAISNSLDEVIIAIEEDIDGQEAYLVGPAIEAAIAAWKDIAEKAETYRTNAYITVIDPKDTAKIMAAGLKLNRKLKELHAAA